PASSGPRYESTRRAARIPSSATGTASGTRSASANSSSGFNRRRPAPSRGPRLRSLEGNAVALTAISAVAWPTWAVGLHQYFAKDPPEEDHEENEIDRWSRFDR